MAHRLALTGDFRDSTDIERELRFKHGRSEAEEVLDDDRIRSALDQVCKTALEDTPGPVNVADARSGIRLGLVNGSLTDAAQLEPQVDGFSLFAIGRWRRRSRTPELTPVFCWLCPRGLASLSEMIRPARRNPAGRWRLRRLLKGTAGLQDHSSNRRQRSYI